MTRRRPRDHGWSRSEKFRVWARLILVLSAGWLGARPAPASGIDPIVKARWPHHDFPTPGQVAVSGHNVYVAGGQAGLLIFDVSAPAHSRQAGHFALDGGASDVATMGDYVLVASAGRQAGGKTVDSALYILEASNTRQTRQVARYNAQGRIVSLATFKTYVMLADAGAESNGTSSGAGVDVLDLTKPEQPKRISRFDTRGPVSAVGMSGTVAGFTETLVNPKTFDNAVSLLLVDLADPGGPRLVSRMPLQGAVVVGNGWAYHANGAGLEVLDLAVPATPRAVGTIDIEGAVWPMLVAGTQLYVSQDTGRVAIIDLSRPSQPRLLGSYGARVMGGLSAAVSGMNLSGTRLFITTSKFAWGWIHVGAALEVVDVSTPAAPRQSSVSALASDARGLALSGPLVYVANAAFGLQIFDASSPRELRTVADLPTDYAPLDVACDGKTVCLSAPDRLELIDVSDPQAPRVLGRYLPGTNAWPQRVTTSPGRAFLNCWVGNSNLLDVIDIADPANPKQLRRFDVNNWRYGLPGANEFSFVRDPQNGWQIYAPSPSEGPVLVGGYEAIASAIGSLIAGNLAYTPWGVIDVTAPARPLATDINFYPGNNAVAAGNLICYPDQASLWIYDSSTPATVRSLGAFQIDSVTLSSGLRGSGTIHKVALRGSDAFLAAGYDGVVVVDLAHKSALNQVGRYSGMRSGYRRRIAVDGAYAYVASGPAGLRVLETSTPDAPSLVAVADTNALAAAVAGRYAFVAGGTAGLRVIDIASPKAPVLKAVLPLEGAVIDVTLLGNYACAVKEATWTGEPVSGGGLVIIDVSDPERPKQIAFLEMRGNPTAVQVAGESVAVLDEGVWNGPFRVDGGLDVISLSDPAQPRRVGRFGANGLVVAMAVEGNRVYLSERGRWDGWQWVDGGITAVDLSNPANPQRLGQYPTAQSADALAAAGGTVYIAGPAWVRGLDVLDFSSPAGPRALGSLTGGAASALAIAGTRLLAAESEIDLKVIDISTPASPRWLGAIATEGNIYRARLEGSTVFGSGPSGIQIFDVSDFAHPRPLGRHVTRTEPAELAVAGDFVYVAERGIANSIEQKDGRLAVVDVRDRERPRLAGSCELQGAALDLAFAGAVVGIAKAERGLDFIDASDPTAPKILSTLGVPAVSISMTGARAYVAAGAAGLLVIDISDPSGPRQVGAGPTTASAQLVEVGGRLAYVADDAGLEVFDIADPSAPRWVSGFPNRGESPFYSLSAWGPYVSATNGRTVQLFDFSDPRQPIRITGSSAMTEASFADMAGGRLVLAAGGNLHTLQADAFFKSISPRNGALEVVWESWNRARLQRATRIANPDWQDLALPGSGDTTRVPIATGNVGFLRLREP